MAQRHNRPFRQGKNCLSFPVWSTMPQHVSHILKTGDICWGAYPAGNAAHGFDALLLESENHRLLMKLFNYWS